MDIGITYDLKQEFSVGESDPEDRLEEYDSEVTVEAIGRALEAQGHHVRRLGGGRKFVEAVLQQPPELVFNIAEGYGTRSREAHVPSVLEMLGIPFTHSDPLTLAVTLDKGIAKRLVATAGLPTPRFMVVERREDVAGCGLRARSEIGWSTMGFEAPGSQGARRAHTRRYATDEQRSEAGWIGSQSDQVISERALSFPVMVKPLFEGSSMGIRSSSRVEDPPALQARVELLLQDYQQPVLVEEFCPGPEFTVGVLGNGDAVRPIGVMEIVPRRAALAEFVYSLEVKRNYLEEVEYRVPPDRPPELLREVERVAVGCYRALGCRDVSRIDLRVGADGEPKFLEVNPLPGLHPVTSDVAILSGRMGLSYEGLIGAIVDAARARYGI